MIVSVPCDMRKESIKDTSFEMNKISEKRAYKFL